MQSFIWGSTIPLCIRHDTSAIPYLVNVPRNSYLPLLLPRLNSFFRHNFGGRGVKEDANVNNKFVNATSFSYDGILLKNLPVGLLYDLYQPLLPWQLSLGNGPLYEMHDTFINSVKEADFVRNGTAKGIMSMSKENSTQLWNSVQDNDFRAFHKIHQVLLNPPTPLKHIPLRLYVPSVPNATTGFSSFNVIQMLVPPITASQEIQSVGSALSLTLPTLFPSRGEEILAQPILHGAPVPFHAPLIDLMKEAAYADGWLHVCIRMLDRQIIVLPKSTVQGSIID
ncbi:putative atg5 protein [Erysiphe necator]|uniref:Autophagy protein 5 n=1 Tax=Uncinula necator TaxID=52586 RepID=A0A0B1P7M6_UNCNE|nr:putative atg5 protein [Erysiphe necator]